MLTTENSDDLELWIPEESRSLKVTPVNSSCVIVPEAVFYTVLLIYSLRLVRNHYFTTPLAFNAPDGGVSL